MAQILGLGNPLLDISVEVENLELLEKYGLKMGNAILAGPEHQALYAEVVSKFGSSVQYIAGGATQNSIRVAQWVGGESSGYTGYVGAIGSDEFGTTLTKSAQSEGVTTLYQVSSEKPTGTCAVLVYQQERSLVANLAASETLQVSHLDTDAVKAAIDSARVIYCAGFPLTHPGGAASVEKLGKISSENGKIFATNLSAPFIVQVSVFFFQRRFDNMFPYCFPEWAAFYWRCLLTIHKDSTICSAALRDIKVVDKTGASRESVIRLGRGCRITPPNKHSSLSYEHCRQ
jgi:adenosine kinase